jgi:hypothetical protein
MFFCITHSGGDQVMRTATLVLIATMAAAAPVAAQDWRFRGSTEQRLNQEYRQIGWEYERALRSGRIERREAERIERRLDEIDRLGRRYARDGFNRGERQRIERLLRETRGEIHFAMQDRGWREADWRRNW